MGNLIWEDKDAFLKLQADNGFAIEVFYDGLPAVDVIFDEETQILDPGTAEIRSAGPMITGKEIDFPGLATNKTVGIGIITYFVKSWLRDGTGFIEIFLTTR